jgi:molybdopterin molybdotransferase
MPEPPSRTDAVEILLRLRHGLFEATPTAAVERSAIGGRVLANAIEAPRDDPPMSRSTMDGYAVASDDADPRQIRREEVYPEDEQPPMAPGEAVPVATGGAIPERADAVLKREDVTVAEGELRGPAVEAGTNVYARGSNFSAGEVLFDRGERLSPKDAVLLADLDVEEVLVRERWSVGVLATGTEIHEGTLPDRDSEMLGGAATAWGHTVTYEGTVPDDADQLRDRLGELARRHDVVLTSGGTSVGSRDHITSALADHGDVLLSDCAISPGSSTTVGRLTGTAVVAVPGRPVAAHAAALLFVRPLLTGLTAYPTLQATADHDIALGPAGECLIPVVLEEETGKEPERTARQLDAEPGAETATFRPSVLSSMTRATRADGFVLTDEPIAAGEPIDVVPYAGVEQL